MGLIICVLCYLSILIIMRLNVILFLFLGGHDVRTIINIILVIVMGGKILAVPNW